MKKILLLFFCYTAMLVNAQNAENDPGFIITGTGFNGAVRAMTVQSDGKVVVGGSFTSYNGTTRNYIARLNSDGTLDNTFDAGATLGATVLAVAIDGSGNIVCGGAFSSSVKRLTSTGANDGTFALAGTGLNGPLNTLAIQGDGNILIGGTFTSYDGTSRNRIARLLATGALDNSFNPGTGLSGAPTRIGIQADGKIVVVGGSSGFSSYNGTSRDNLVRIETTGVIDATFVPPVNLLANLHDVKFQSDNKIIITGQYNGNTNSNFNGVARLNTNGSMDNSFAPTFFQGGRTILIQGDGKIVVAGVFVTPSFPIAIRRLNTNGTTDPFFVGDGFVKSGGAEVSSVVIQDGKILAAGDFTAFNGTARNNMARITTCSSVSITTQPAGKTICVGNDVTFSVVASGSGLNYKWQLKDPVTGIYNDLSDGSGNSGTATADFSIASATIGMNANRYRCLITDASCTTTSSAALLTVLASPVVDTHPMPSTVCAGTNATFTVAVTNPGLYQWQEDTGTGFVDILQSGIYSGVGTATLTIVGTSASLNGYKYRCVVGSCSPSVISNDALLTVNSAPVITAQPAATVSSCTGTTAQFTVTATGGTGYQWQEKIGSGSFTDINDGGIYGGATTSTLTLTGATVTQHGNQYRCTVVGICNATSTTSTLIVYATPSFSTHPANSTKCVGGSTNFTVALAVTPSGMTYQWQEKVGSGSYVNITNGGIYSDATTTTLTIIGLTAAMDGNKYRCVAGTCSPSATSFEADLTVYEQVNLTTQPVPLTACPGTDATFSVVAVSDGTITYQWQEQVFGGSFVNVTNGGSYSGATSATLNIAGVTNAQNSYRYRCLVSNGVCSTVTSNNVLLTVPATASINTQPQTNRVLCGSGNTSFSITVSTSTTYQWQVSADGGAFTDIANDGVYSGANNTILTITGATPALSGNKYRCKIGPCPSTQVLSNEGTLTVNSPPAISEQPVDKTICAGGSTTFAITATGTSITYQWLRDGGALTNSGTFSGVTTSTLTITEGPASLHNGNYSCRVTGVSGCPTAESSVGKLTVNQITINTQPAANTPVCEGATVDFAVDASGPDLTYQWQVDTGAGFADITNAGVYSGVTTNSMSIAGVTFNMNNGKYRCVVGGGCSSVNSNFALLGVKQTPAKPVITANLANPEAPVLTAAPGDQFTWFQNGTQVSTSGSLNVTAEGSYTVLNKLSGCEGSLSDAKVILITGAFARNENNVRVYPNPASNKLVISLSGFKAGAAVDITLVDLLGRTVEKASGTGGTETEVSVTQFQPGRYAVILKQGSQRVVSHFTKSN